MDLLPLLQFVGMAGAIYGAIRMDIKNIHANIAETQANATRAHVRIDSMLERKR